MSFLCSSTTSLYSPFQRRKRQNEPSADHAAALPQRVLCGKYISLESKIAKNKNLYYDALEACQRGWYENQEDPAPFIKYLLRTILAAYRDFEDRVDLVSEKLPAVEVVRRAVYGKIGKFTKRDIMELCPTIGKTSVENSIKQLVDRGVLVKHGSGRSTYYTRSDAE